jgi:pyrimidine deaminase RibD-like protein
VIKPTDPRQLAIDLLPRSLCQVRVAAVIADSRGIFSWGWNFPGFTGFGMHAEAHAIMRANRGRLKGSTVYVAGERHRNGKYVLAKPCEDCQRRIHKAGIRAAYYRDADGVWRLM